MTIRISKPVLFALGVFVGTLLALAARAIGGPRPVAESPPHPVRVVDSAGKTRTFRCVSYAAQWISHRVERPREVFVTDETSGAEVRADAAWYVRGEPLPRGPAGDRVRAFAGRGDAERHAASVRGTLLLGETRPFESRTGADDATCR